LKDLIKQDEKLVPTNMNVWSCYKNGLKGSLLRHLLANEKV